MAVASEKERWLGRLRAAVSDGSFVKLSLSGYRGKETSLKQVLVRRVRLRAGDRLSFVYRHATRDVTRQHTDAEGFEVLSNLVGAVFQQAHLFATNGTVRLEFSEGSRPRLIEGKPVHAASSSVAHDREKKRLIDPKRSGWLHALGVTTADGKVCAGMEAKFRQINKFVELLQHLLSGRQREIEQSGSCQSSLVPGGNSPIPAPFSLVDMGSGKGYLTFAAYDWLRRSGWPAATVRGVEERTELVNLSNQIASESGFDQLRFETGRIGDVPLDHVDVLVALHACDTATDDAIAKGVTAGAWLILVAPCCHKELRPQLRPPPVLAGALKHGILLQREAEFVTDALRAALLEWAGYDTKVFEFISTEHTSKNLMIAATKRKIAGDRDELRRRARELAVFYGIGTQRLGAQLGFDFS